jgi:hypothetical protein
MNMKKLNTPLQPMPRFVTARPEHTMETVKEASPAFRELMDRIDGDPNPPKRPSQMWAACKEAGSTDEFPQLLGTTAGKRVIQAFQSWTPKWPLIAAIDNVNKLGVSIPRIFVGEAANLVLKPEGANIRRNYFTDAQYTVSANTYASGLAFTREAMVNDDLGELMKSADKMGRAAARTVDVRLGTLIRANGTAYDGAAFFHATNPTAQPHANTVTTALSADLVGANLLKVACQAIRKQKDIDNRQFLGKTPGIAFCSIDLWDTLAALCGLDMVAAPTVAAPTYTAQNPAYRYGLKPIEFPDLGDTTDWYVAQSPNDADPAWVVSFLNGRAAPMVLQKKLLYGGDFDFANPACDIEYDVIYDFEVSMGDPRSAYAGIVSGGT